MFQILSKHFSLQQTDGHKSTIQKKTKFFTAPNLTKTANHNNIAPVFTSPGRVLIPLFVNWIKTIHQTQKKQGKHPQTSFFCYQFILKHLAPNPIVNNEESAEISEKKFQIRFFDSRSFIILQRNSRRGSSVG